MSMIDTIEVRPSADELLRHTIRTEREHRLAYEETLARSGLTKPAWNALTEEEREEFRIINRLVWVDMPECDEGIPFRP